MNTFFITCMCGFGFGNTLAVSTLSHFSPFSFPESVNNILRSHESVIGVVRLILENQIIPLSCCDNPLAFLVESKPSTIWAWPPPDWMIIFHHRSSIVDTLANSIGCSFKVNWISITFITLAGGSLSHSEPISFPECFGSILRSNISAIGFVRLILENQIII